MNNFATGIRSRFPLQLTFCLALALLLGACQTTVQRSATGQGRALEASLPASCTNSIRSFRDDVERGRVANASAPPLPFFPLLHSNRFLHALSDSVETQAQTVEWASQLAAMGIQARASENRNLVNPWNETDMLALAECSRIFASSGEFGEERTAILSRIRETEFPDSYREGRQALGALPLLRPFLKQQILAEQASERSKYLEDETFARSTTYRLADERSELVAAAEWMQTAYGSNALRLPLLSDSELDALLAAHAPGLEVEFQQENDKIGAPRWQAGQVTVDTESPVVYTLPSMTQFEGKNLLQLNYVFWFSERRPRSLIDLYAGAIDSIIWRVTLDEDGSVLLYDSIHSCGCYHKYFAIGEGLMPKAEPASREPALIFLLQDKALPSGIVLRLTANEHFIVGIEESSGDEELGYSMFPYSRLENLTSGSGGRSLFDARGLIPGSERLERFTLWPTGILSVGAMRQWGTHATGFIQNQHFDDARLFEDYFEMQP